MVEAFLACRTGAIFLRFSGERGQARGEREVRDTRDGRGACLALRASPRSPEKRKKITPVLLAEAFRKIFYQKKRLVASERTERKQLKQIIYS